MKAWSESDFGDDVVTLSDERTLREQDRDQAAGDCDRTLTGEWQSGAASAQEVRVLPAATFGGVSMARAGEASRAASESDLRSVSVTIRLSKAECARLHDHAAEAGVTVSAYLRSCTFEAEALRAEVKAALAELRAAATKDKPASPARVRRAWLTRVVRFLAGRHSTNQAC